MRKKVYYGIIFIVFLATIFLGGYFYFNEGNSPNGPQNQNESNPTIPFKDGSEKDNRIIQNSDLSRLFPDVICRIKETDENIIALTFDDGPDDNYTPKILEHLKNENVKATFFITGVRAQEFPKVLKRIADEGHVIGSHGFQHQKFSNLDSIQIKQDLEKNHDLIEKHTNVKSKLFRPPYGDLDPETVSLIEKEGYKVILWSIDSLDWRSISEKEILDNILADVLPGSVILMHSAGDVKQDLTGSVESVPILIKELKEKDYSFVTIPELFGLEAYYSH